MNSLDLDRGAPKSGSGITSTAAYRPRRNVAEGLGGASIETLTSKRTGAAFGIAVAFAQAEKQARDTAILGQKATTPPPPAPVTRQPRNARCACSSGKKWKACCGAPKKPAEVVTDGTRPAA